MRGRAAGDEAAIFDSDRFDAAPEPAIGREGVTYGLEPDRQIDKRAAASAPAASLQVELAISCVRCGYALTGLTTDGVCPECAAPVSESVRGDRLQFAPASYLRSLHIGARLAMAASIGVLLALVLAWLPGLTIAPFMRGPPPAVFMVLSAIEVGLPVLSLCAWLVGWVLLTPPYVGVMPGAAEHRSRRAVRVLAAGVGAVAFVLFGLGFVVPITLIPASIYSPMITTAGFVLAPLILVMFFASERYLRQLHRRTGMSMSTHRLDIHRWLWGALSLLTVIISIAVISGGPTGQTSEMVLGLCALLALVVLIALMGTHAAVMSAVAGEVAKVRVRPGH